MVTGRTRAAVGRKLIMGALASSDSAVVVAYCSLFRANLSPVIERPFYHWPSGPDFVLLGGGGRAVSGGPGRSAVRAGAAGEFRAHGGQVLGGGGRTMAGAGAGR